MDMLKDMWETLGLSIKLNHWLYVMVVRTIITYGVIAWKPKAQQAIMKVTSLQKMAILPITRTISSFPSLALGALLSLLPLHIVVEREVKLTAFRL